MIKVNKSKLGSSCSNCGKSGFPIVSVIVHSLFKFTVLVSVGKYCSINWSKSGLKRFSSLADKWIYTSSSNAVALSSIPGMLFMFSGGELGGFSEILLLSSFPVGFTSEALDSGFSVIHSFRSPFFNLIGEFRVDLS